MNGPQQLPPRGAARPEPVALAGPALVATVFVALVVWSWGKWPDVLVDFGRELYVPWRLSEGQRLHVDLAYFNGPFSPWLNATLFRVFGTGLRTLVLANLVVAAGVAAGVWVLSRRVAGRLAATTGTLVYLTLFAFGQYSPQGNYNFVTPYSHEMTHGLALSLAALLFLDRHLRSGGTRSALGCGVAAGLAFLTKAELVAALGVALPAGFVLHHALARTPRGAVLRALAAFAGGALGPVLAAFLLLSRDLPAAAAARATLGSWNYVFLDVLRENKLYRDMLGVSDLARSLRTIGAWSLRWVAVLVAAAAAAMLVRRAWRYSAAACAALVPLGALAALARWKTTEWDTFAHPLPLTAAIVGAAALVAALRSAHDPRRATRHVLSFALALFALALTAKIGLNVRLMHYGFVLAMPAAVVIVVALLDAAPAALGRRGGNPAAFRAASVGLIAGVTLMHLYATNSWYERKTVRVGQGRDAFLTDGRGRVVNDVLARLGALRSPGDTLVVLPEGVMLNYLARMPNPTPYFNFMPPELAMFGEGRIVAALEATPPEWVVFADRRAPEYGFEMLGTDYGLEILRAVERRFVPAAEIGEPDSTRAQLRFAAILRRADAAAPGPASATRP